MYVILNDGTRINNCVPGTTSDCIIHSGETYAAAAEIMDVITSENAISVRVYEDNNTESAYSGNLVLLPGGTMADAGEYKTCTVSLRHKTDIEIMKDEIAELQDVVIDG